MTKERLTLNKRFLIIDSPIPFTLIANEGTDRVYRPAGAWQLNIWELLPERFFKQYPVFNLELEYDETLLEEGKEIIVRESDINLGTGLSGVNGQLVAISGDEVGLARETTLQTVAKEETLLNFFNNFNFKRSKINLADVNSYVVNDVDSSAVFGLFEHSDSTIKQIFNLKLGKIYIRNRISGGYNYSWAELLYSTITLHDGYNRFNYAYKDNTGSVYYDSYSSAESGETNNLYFK